MKQELPGGESVDTMEHTGRPAGTGRCRSLSASARNAHYFAARRAAASSLHISAPAAMQTKL